MYKGILKNKGILIISEYLRLARHMLAKPAHDNHLCSIFLYFSIFTYTWFGTKFGRKEFQKILDLACVYVSLKISNQFEIYFVFSLIYKLTYDFFLLKTAAFDWVVWFIVPNTKEIIIIYRYKKNAKNVLFFLSKNCIIIGGKIHEIEIVMY